MYFSKKAILFVVTWFWMWYECNQKDWKDIKWLYEKDFSCIA